MGADVALSAAGEQRQLANKLANKYTLAITLHWAGPPTRHNGLALSALWSCFFCRTNDTP